MKKIYAVLILAFAILVSCSSNKSEHSTATESTSETKAGWVIETTSDNVSAGSKSATSDAEEYQTGYNFGYDMGYIAGHDNLEYNPYLPVGPNACPYTLEYRTGYTAGYSAGYEYAQAATQQGIYAPEDEDEDAYEIIETYYDGGADFDEEWDCD